MTALIGSLTLKYTTASSRTVTLSEVMQSCGWIGSVTVRKSTRCIRSTPGTSIIKPGPRGAVVTRPSRNTTPRSYSCVSLTNDRITHQITTSAKNSTARVTIVELSTTQLLS